MKPLLFDTAPTPGRLSFSGVDATIAHALWQAQGAPPELKVRRGRVAMINGYPSSAGITLLLEESEMMAFAARTDRLQHRSAAGACGVGYQAPARLGTLPEIALSLDGC